MCFTTPVMMSEKHQMPEFIPTRHSLLTRLKNWEDHEGWREFFDTYWKLIYGVATKSGLNDQEAQEVVQETVITVAKNIHRFKTDPAHGSFKAWLLKTTRWRIINQVKKRPTNRDHPHRGESRHEDGTGTMERIADPAGPALEQVWDREWKKNLMDAALERVKRQVKYNHYQIFYLSVVKDMPARDVAKSLGVTAAQVYVIRFRVSRRVRQIFEKLTAGDQWDTAATGGGES